MRKGLQFIVAVILARLLSPEEFGTIALLYLFFGLAGTFIDSGFSAALIQRQDATHTDESTVFWFNFSMSALMSIFFWASAPFIAEFYGYPVLVPLIKVLALSVILNALGAIHMTLMTKQLDFKTPLKIGVVATLASGTVAIILAMNSYGVWALAIQTVTASMVTTMLLWVYSSWRPTLVFSMGSVRRLFGFGGYLMLAGLLDVAYNRLYTLLIGKFYSVVDLGFYARAETTKQIPVEVLSASLARVAFPVFSAVAHNREKLRRGAQLALRGLMLINVPMMLGLMVTAENVVSLVFGDKWLPSVPILQVLCLAGVFWPLHVINLSTLKALGHSHLFFRLEVIKKIVGTFLMVIGMLTYGVIGIAWSQVVFAIIGFLINSYYTNRYIDYGVTRQLYDVFPIAVISIFMALSVYALGLFPMLPLSAMLALQVAAGITMYFIILILFKINAYKDMINLFLRSN